MKTIQEATAEWMRQNPGVSYGGTAALPPPEFIQAYEQARLAERVAELETRVERLEQEGGDA